MDFQIKDIPEVVKHRQNGAEIAERRIDVETKPGEKLSVYYQEGIPSGTATHPSVLLLHGMKFTSQTWRDLGTIATVTAVGHRVIAIDLPGYGNTQGEVEDKGAFLKKFSEAVNIGDTVVVAPSMSGSYALPYLFEQNGPSSGFIPVAPVGTERFTKQQYEGLNIPVMIVYGENDQLPICPESKKNLSQTPNHVIQCFKDGGHPCYLNDPDLWHKLLYSFLNKME